MRITKAVITAAGREQRTLPLHMLVDRDGEQKSAFRIIIEEALAAGIEEIGVVICPGDREVYAKAAGSHAGRLQFVEQHQPRGYGHALTVARSLVGSDPFLHLISDHLYISSESRRCAQQLVEAAAAEECSMCAVQATRENMLPLYGTVGGRRVPKSSNLYLVEAVREKPTPTQAEQELIVPGLRAGHYLCFFGMHVLNGTVLDILERQLRDAPAGQSIQLSPALAELATRERYLAIEISGQRFNMGVKYGLLLAQMALALSGADRAEVLEQIVQLLIAREKPAA